MLRRTVPALAVGALFTLSACGNGTGGTNTSGDGLKTGPGVTDKEISVGLLTDYSGPLAEGATSGSLGMELKFDEVNAAGGICGRKVVAVKGDTKFDPQQTSQAYRSISRKIVMVGELLGNGSVTAVQKNIERDELPSLAISMNTTTLKAKDVYVPLPVFEVELINGLAWVAETAKASEENPVKVGTVTGTDPYGEVFLEALKSAAKSLPGVEIVSSPTVTFGDKDFTAQVSDLKKSGADYVLLGTAPGETAGLVGTSAQLGYSPSWVAASGAWYVALAQPLKGLLDKFYVSAGYGTMADNVPGTAAIKAAMEKYAPDAKPSDFLVAGWLFGNATVAALEKACENKDLTREGVTEALKNLQVDYQGITPTATVNDDKIASYSSRINKVGSQGELVPQGEFAASEAAKAWGADNGF